MTFTLLWCFTSVKRLHLIRIYEDDLSFADGCTALTVIRGRSCESDTRVSEFFLFLPFANFNLRTIPQWHRCISDGQLVNTAQGTLLLFQQNTHFTLLSFFYEPLHNALEMQQSHLQNLSVSQKAQWHEWYFWVSSDFVFVYRAFRRRLLPGLVFPVKTVPPFITQSLWYQPPSVVSMTSLESSPKSLHIKECDAWSSNNSARPPWTSDQNQTLYPTRLVLAFILQQIAILNKKHFEKHNRNAQKVKGGEPSDE